MISFEQFPKLALALKTVCENFGSGQFCEPFSSDLYEEGGAYGKPSEEELLELYESFEKALAPLSSQEIAIVAIDGNEEAELLINQYNLEPLNDFINRYFEEDVV
jgi:hypothetical protein